MRYADLIFIDPENNNNRSCVMKQITDQIFVSEIKRVDDKGRAFPRKFPMSVWDQYLQTKLQEGYIDRNADNSLVTRRVKNAGIAGTGKGFRHIEDKNVRYFWNFLLEKSQEAIAENYDIKAEKVSAEMIAEAKNKIRMLSGANDIKECNAILKDLFILIPRKMSVVSDCLITATDDRNDPHYIGNVIEREETLLSAMDVNRIMSDSGEKSNMTHPESLGLDIRPFSKEKERAVKAMMGKEEYLYWMGFEVHNKSTRQRFNAYCDARHIKTGNPIIPTKVQNMKDIDNSVIQVFHGTANINGMSLMIQGPRTNPSAKITGRLFGTGSYGGLQLLKSLGYTDILGSCWRQGSGDKGIIFIYNVAVTKTKHLDSHSNGGVRPYTAESIAPYDTVYAHRGYNMGGARLRNDEIIAYRPEEGQMDVTDILLLKGKIK